MKTFTHIALLLACLLPISAVAQQGTSNSFGPAAGDREMSISGAGSSDRRFKGGSFGITGDYGWYRSDQTVWGIRQSVNYASIRGESITDDFWNGSTRAYMNYQFGAAQARPFVGASLGFVYGDGVKNSGFSGLETGMKYYMREKTYFLARVEYQFFFSKNRNEFEDSFKDGAWAYTVGLGYNF
ncbi:MAG: hypothetical protein ACXIUM_07355 [Wenzhouxiangella sp.]